MLTPLQRAILGMSPLTGLSGVPAPTGGGIHPLGSLPPGPTGGGGGGPDPGGPLHDHSGNGHDLTQLGNDPATHDSGGKYGQGFDYSGSGLGTTGLQAPDESVSPELDMAGDFAVFVAFTRDGAGFSTPFSFMDPETNGASSLQGGVRWDGNNNQWQWIQHDGSSFQTINDGFTSTGSHQMWVTRKNDNVRVSLDGSIIIDGTLAPTPDHPDTRFCMANDWKGQNADQTLNGKIYEGRVWGPGSIPSDATLDQIADPNDLTHQNTLEGNETACYFLETIS